MKLLPILFAASILALTGCATTKTPDFVPLVYPAAPQEPRFMYERTFFSSADVAEKSSLSSRFKSFATGSSKASQGFIKPYGVAVHRGRIYVTDSRQGTITMFDVPGQRFRKFGQTGAATLGKPLGIDISEAGEIFVADVKRQAVLVYDLEGNFLRIIGNKKLLQRPVGVTVNNEGTRLYVVDNGGIREKKNHQVVVFDAQSGEKLKVFGERGIEEGQFNLPLLASSDDQGNVYVVDGGNFRVQKFNAEGELMMAFGKQGRFMGDFNRPKGIAIDPDGNIYVMDSLLSHLLLFNPNGHPLMLIGESAEETGPGKYMMAADVDVDEDGRIYVVDQIFRKVDVFLPYGMKIDEGYLGAKMLEDGSLEVKPSSKVIYEEEEPSDTETTEEAVELDDVEEAE